MRSILLIILVSTSLSLKAQVFTQPSMIGYSPMGLGGRVPVTSLPAPEKKWFVSTYAGIEAGVSSWSGGSSSYLSVPLTLQLNRRLTDNLYAFGAVTVAPSWVNFDGAFMNPGTNRGGQPTGFLGRGYPGLYSRAEMGMYYINDSRTFSISGSISVSQGTYPAMPYYWRNPNPQQAGK